MPRTKIDDLPVNEEIGKEEAKEIVGGGDTSMEFEPVVQFENPIIAKDGDGTKGDDGLDEFDVPLASNTTKDK